MDIFDRKIMYTRASIPANRWTITHTISVLAHFSDKSVNIEQFVDDSADILSLGFDAEFDY